MKSELRINGRIFVDDESAAMQQHQPARNQHMSHWMPSI